MRRKDFCESGDVVLSNLYCQVWNWLPGRCFPVVSNVKERCFWGEFASRGVCFKILEVVVSVGVLWTFEELVSRCFDGFATIACQIGYVDVHMELL